MVHLRLWNTINKEDHRHTDYRTEPLIALVGIETHVEQEA